MQNKLVARVPNTRRIQPTKRCAIDEASTLFTIKFTLEWITLVFCSMFEELKEKQQSSYCLCTNKVLYVIHAKRLYDFKHAGQTNEWQKSFVKSILLTHAETLRLLFGNLNKRSFSTNKESEIHSLETIFIAQLHLNWFLLRVISDIATNRMQIYRQEQTDNSYVNGFGK